MVSVMVMLSGVLSVTTPANAITTLPDGITCTDLFWDSKNRLNPTELSDYQECILATTTDEDHGRLGDFFWIKLDDEYYSFNLRNLIKSFTSREKAEQAMQLWILKTTTEHNKRK